MLQIEPSPKVYNNIRSTQEQLVFIRDTLTLNMSELAKILQVTRPTVYAWLDGQQEPKPDALRKVENLTEIAENITHLDIHRMDMLLHRPIINSKSFFDYLCTFEIENIFDSLNILKKNF